jgi:uncharacterized protein YsxB (DUF464 family)
MVTVELYLDEKNLIKGFSVEGHSGYAPHGEDIVCSAISTLTQTAVLGLTEYLHLNPQLTIKSGDMKCFLPKQLTEEQLILTQAILQTLALGLEAIAKSYGKYLVIHKRRWS